MNIVKEFEDQDFFQHPKISTPEYHSKYTWYWGLGDNGKIYFRCTRFSIPDDWHDLSFSSDIAPLIGLKTMKKIVKQFGHLLVFT
jgi:hypothetical protein